MVYQEAHTPNPSSPSAFTRLAESCGVAGWLPSGSVHFIRCGAVGRLPTRIRPSLPRLYSIRWFLWCVGEAPPRLLRVYGGGDALQRIRSSPPRLYLASRTSTHPPRLYLALRDLYATREGILRPQSATPARMRTRRAGGCQRKAGKSYPALE